MNDGINNPPPRPAEIKPAEIKTAEIKTAEISTAATDFQNLHELLAKARANLNQNVWDYIIGGTETETTLRRNRMSLDEIAFRPRVLRDVSKVDASVQIMGRKLRLPVMLAPVGALETFDPSGGGAVARGVGTFGAAHMLSSVSEPGLENVAKAAPDALRIYQLYVRGDDAFVDDRIERAIANNYAAFCLTVDTAHYSRRERDLAKRYVRSNRRNVSGREFQMALDWRTVKRIKDSYKIPLVIKGIASAEDAAIAVDHGVEWIYVSNHGGRQLDHGRGAMHVLPEVVAAVGGRAKIMIDGSFCRGTDIVKAIASGADLVGIGRLQCWALAAGGEAGIVRMLELLEDEVQRCLGLLGVNTFAELDKSYLHAAAPTNSPDVFSAFPLLQIEPYRY
jgi:isopentenyl diphosphate isomerase/L-lactate dehydrogenase-like FMN-dependent dehydrogenase